MCHTALRHSQQCTMVASPKDTAVGTLHHIFVAVDVIISIYS